MKFEKNIYIDAPVEKIFNIYKYVEKWREWDPEVKDSAIEGKFVVGAKGFLTPNNGFRNKFDITELENNKFFTVRIKLPLCMMDFEHELDRTALGTNVIHRIVFSGVLGGLFGTVLGKKLINEQVKTLNALKLEAEKQSNS